MSVLGFFHYLASVGFSFPSHLPVPLFQLKSNLYHYYSNPYADPMPYRYTNE